MKKSLLFVVIIIAISTLPGNTQKVYHALGWEMLFQWADVELAGSNVVSRPVRFTGFFHLGSYTHLDFNNNIGMYTGLALRNVGFIYDEDIPQKTIRRSYTLGLPVAIKVGSFKDHLYFFGGGEYELLFLYKGKRWMSNERSGPRIKETAWFSNKTERFVPSVFLGVQFPGGINLKFKKYFGDFLNKNYVGPDFGQQNISFENYRQLNLYYISLSWQFRTNKEKNYPKTNDQFVYNFQKQQ
jgi:hypothetical protein